MPSTTTRAAHGARRLFRRAAMAVTMTTAGGLGVAAVTAASVPEADGTISACRRATTGELRIIDPAAGQSCQGRLELPIVWNQQGEPGPPGPAGPAGVTKTITVTNDDTVAPGKAVTIDVACPAGTVVTGGGYQPLEVDAIAEHLVVLQSVPLKAQFGLPDRYRIRVKNVGTTFFAQVFVVAVCAK